METMANHGSISKNYQELKIKNFFLSFQGRTINRLYYKLYKLKTNSLSGEDAKVRN